MQISVRVFISSSSSWTSPPGEVYATLLDEGTYLCSERTMYRLLAEHAEVRERRDQLRHPVYAAPELLARRPNELWSWDITKLLGPTKWTYFCLYVMLDVFSRYVIGWLVAPRESATLAEQFIRETCARQGIAREQLTTHADRGAAMTSKSVAFLLADLGITKTHARPHVSNDNPFSEAQFKTLKYRPAFPDRFGSIQDARAHGHVFFPWYNTEHHHSGLGLLTPADVHHGLAEQRVAARATVLATAYATHPERFPAGLPHPPVRPVEVWINPPKTRATEETRGLAATHSGVLTAVSLTTRDPGSYSRPTVLAAHCHLGLGKLYRRTGKRDEAREHLANATTMYREMGMTYWLEKAEMSALA